VIPTVIAQALSGDGQIRLGSASPTRDFNFVLDTVSAFRAVGESPVVFTGQTFNTGSGREISIGSLVDLISSITGRELSLVTEEARIRPAKSEVDRLLAETSRLRAATGWQPRFSLEEGLTKTVEWIRDSREMLSRAATYHR
jgi:UDP-glucose 4-epimerase